MKKRGFIIASIVVLVISVTLVVSYINRGEKDIESGTIKKNIK